MIRVQRSVIAVALALAASITLPLTADASETKGLPTLDVTAEGLSVNGVPIPFAPKRIFQGKLRISGVEWPTGRSITDAQSTIRGLAVDERSFGVMYDVDVEKIHVSSYVDSKSKLSKTITIRFGPSRTPGK